MTLLDSSEPRVRRQRGTDSYLSRFTYSAMLVWAVGETMDSIPALIRLMGLSFMVYGSIVWSLALLLAIIGSIALLFLGPHVHRPRIVIWYCLLVFAVLAVRGPLSRLAVEITAATMPAIWLAQTIRQTRSKSRATP